MKLNQKFLKDCWLFMAVDGKGRGVVPLVETPQGTLAFFAYEEVRLEQLKPHAQELADHGGMALHLVYFTDGVVIETYEPRGRN